MALFFGLIGFIAIWMWSSTATIIIVVVLALAAFIEWSEKNGKGETLKLLPHNDPRPKKITDDDMDEYSQLAAPVGQMFSIIYVDRGGKFSNRLISLISIETDLGDVRLYAYCYHAGDERTFISTSIQIFYNPFTGVIFNGFQDAMDNGMSIHAEFMKRRKISRKNFK